MTVNTVSPAIISRAEFNLNAGQTKTPQLVRMDFGNLVTNGGFDTDTDWTKPTGYSISAGVASYDGTGVLYSKLSSGATSAVFGRRYIIGLTVSNLSASNISFGLATSSGVTFQDTTTAVSSDGTYTHTQVADETTSTISIQNNTAAQTFDLDNVSLYEVDPSDDAPWLRLPYGYSVGRTGMIVRDGVILHPSDYTEIKDSGQTWIKPLVSPGASTEFSIWGSTA